MLKEFVKYLKQVHCYDEYVAQLAKHHKSFEKIEQKLKPIHWIDSVFLWSESPEYDWGEINLQWLKQLQGLNTQSHED